MKILMVVHGFPPECSGGTESYLLRLTQELRARRHDVRVLTGSHEGRESVTVVPFVHDDIPGYRLHRSGLFVDNWDKSLAPEIDAGLATVLESFRPDIVHVHHWIRLSRHLIEWFHDRGIPCVATLHDLWTTCPIAFRIRQGNPCALPAGSSSCHDCAPHGAEASNTENAEALDLFADDTRNEVRLARRIIVPSNAHRRAIVAHHPDAVGRVRVIPHGSISDITPRTRRPRDPNAVIRLAHWGHLSRLKGIDVLLNALADLPPPIKARFHLHLFGTVVYPNERAMVEELLGRIPSTYHAGPFRPESLSEHEFDLAVIPSRCSESYSFVLDEAFLLGVPALVSNHGALPERLNGAGATFESGDPASLSRLLIALAEDPLLLDRFAARLTRPRPFAEHAGAIHDLYREVLTMAAPLSSTPMALRSRRARLLSQKAESRASTIDFLRGDLRNVQGDLERISGVVAEMEHYHREKDKVIAWLRAREQELTAQVTAQANRIEDAHAELLRERDERKRAQVAHEEAITSTSAFDSILQELRTMSSTKQRGLEADVRAAQDAHADAKVTHQAVVEELQTRVHMLGTRLARLEHELELRTAHLEEALAMSAQVTEQRDALDRALEELTETHGLLIADFQTLRSSAADIFERKGTEFDEREALLLELGRAVGDLESRLDGLARARLAEATKDVAPLRTESPSELGLVDRLLRMGAKRPTDNRGPASLKVLFILHQFLPRHVAGTEVYTANLAKALRARGHQPVVLCCEAHHDREPFTHLRRSMDDMLIHEVVQNYTWDSFESTYNCPPMEAILANVLDEERPDVVHIQHLHYFSAGFLRIIRDRGIPIVYHLHDYMLLCPRDGQMRRADGEICAAPIPEKCADCIAHHRLDAELIPSRLRPHHPGFAGLTQLARDVVTRAKFRMPRLDAADPLPTALWSSAIEERLVAWRDAASAVDLFVSPSHFLKAMFVANDMVPAGKILVSDNGQDVSRFTSMPAREFRGVLRFGFVGSIAEHKGLHVLIEAMNGLPEDLLAECEIWGDGRAFIDYTESLQKQITHPRTRLKGPFDPADIATVLSGIDVLVVPSLWYENSPLTIHEAQLARVPVIVSDLGGLAEYVQEGRNGLRFHVGDADDLRKKLLWFLEDPSRVATFDFKTIPIKDLATDAEQTEQRYRALIAARARPG